jgi:hypothetical protein
MNPPRSVDKNVNIANIIVAGFISDPFVLDA